MHHPYTRMAFDSTINKDKIFVYCEACKIYLGASYDRMEIARIVRAHKAETAQADEDQALQRILDRMNRKLP